jgi:ABC-type glutathione transport system ATPase component
MIELKKISKTFRAHRRVVRAVDDADLSISAGEIVGLVGESGSGKSTLGRVMAGLLAADSGEVRFEGKSLADMDRVEKQKFRRAVQVVFQNPMNSLNPRMTAGQTLIEPFLIFPDSGFKKPQDEAAALIERVGLTAAHLARFPRELSGGERQRVSIARAIALKPRLIILDEAVSSLDVLVRAGILNLLLELNKAEGVSFLFISHDLRVVRHLCDKVAVMNGGRIVESGETAQILINPSQNYTRSLLESSGLR